MGIQGNVARLERLVDRADARPNLGQAGFTANHFATC
jgi:hypothetical protein